MRYDYESFENLLIARLDFEHRHLYSNTLTEGNVESI